MAEHATHNHISAKARTEFGKGAARRTRREGLVPAVLYAHGSDPVHVSLPAHEIQLALRVANALLTVSVDGGEEHLALPKQIQRNPIKDTIEHVDLVIVRRGEKVTVEVPIILVGDERDDLVYLLDRQTIALEVEATQIPSDVTIDVSGLDVGAVITAGDLSLPEGAVFNGELDEVLVSVNVPRAAVEETEEEAAEGEGEEGEEASSED